LAGPHKQKIKKEILEGRGGCPSLKGERSMEEDRRGRGEGKLRKRKVGHPCMEKGAAGSPLEGHRRVFNRKTLKNSFAEKKRKNQCRGG